MEAKNGRTFWDLVHENKTIQYSLIAIIILILLGIVFFLSKGFSISTTGISPPHEIVDTFAIKKDSLTVLPNSKVMLSKMENEKFDLILKLIWVVIFLVFLSSLISILFNAISNSRSKSNIYVGETSKKVEVFEYIYKMFNKYTLYDREQSQDLLFEIQSLLKYTIDNGLYIDKHLTTLTNDFTDYFKEVIVDYRKKDFNTEQEFQIRFKRLFK